jgi:hypothetical protein
MQRRATARHSQWKSNYEWIRNKLQCFSWVEQLARNINAGIPERLQYNNFLSTENNSSFTIELL